MRPLIHILLHFLVPGVVARTAFRKRWKRAWVIMTLTNAVDVDHFLATPMYDPDRCSLGFHPLHSYAAIAVYLSLLCFPKLRVIAVGLLLHMLLDGIDGLFMP